MSKKVKSFNDLTLIEKVRTIGFIHARQDEETGEVLTDFPIMRRKRSKRYDSKSQKEFYSAEDFSDWAEEQGCEIRSCGPTVLWKEFSMDAYLRISQHDLVHEEPIEMEVEVA